MQTTFGQIKQQNLKHNQIDDSFYVLPTFNTINNNQQSHYQKKINQSEQQATQIENRELYQQSIIENQINKKEQYKKYIQQLNQQIQLGSSFINLLQEKQPQQQQLMEHKKKPKKINIFKSNSYENLSSVNSNKDTTSTRLKASYQKFFDKIHSFRTIRDKSINSLDNKISQKKNHNPTNLFIPKQYCRLEEQSSKPIRRLIKRKQNNSIQQRNIVKSLSQKALQVTGKYKFKCDKQQFPEIKKLDKNLKLINKKKNINFNQVKFISQKGEKDRRNVQKKQNRALKKFK